MVVLIVIAAIIAIIFCIAMLSINIILQYSDEFALKIRVLFITIRIIPRNKKIRPEKSLPEYVEKRERKAALKEKKKEEKKRKKAEKEKKKSGREGSEKNGQGQPKKKKSAGDIFEMVKDILSSIFSKLPKYLKVRIKKLYVSVGTDDAAKTAIVYGSTMAALPNLLEFINEHAVLKQYGENAISIVPNFISGKVDADIDIRLSIRIWQAVSIGLGALFAYLRHK